MALVPSGHLKVMESQTLGRLGKLSQLNAGNVPQQPPAAAQPARNEIEQQQLGGQTPPAETQAPTEQVPTAPQGEQLPEQTQEIQPVEQAEQQTEKTEGSDLQEAFEAVLQQLGVEERQIAHLRASLFQEKTDLNSGTTQGFYLLPTHTKDKKINRREAGQIAQQLGRQFGLTQVLENAPIQGAKGGMNWKVNFKSAPKPELQTGGSSFDGLTEGTNKSASTMAEMIKARKNEVYETMRRIAGVK